MQVWLRLVLSALLVLLAHCLTPAGARAVISFQSFVSLEVNVGSGGGPQSMALADVSMTADRQLDLLVANSEDDSIGVYLGDEGFFGGPSDADFFLEDGDGSPMAVVVGNFDSSASRRVDVAVLTSTGRVRIFLNTPDPDDPDNEDFDPDVDFTLVFQALAVEGSPRSLVVGRFDNDTRDDIAVLTSTAVYVFLANGDGTFRRQSPVATGGADAFQAIVVDLNDDLVADLAVSDPYTQQVFLLMSDGAGILRMTNAINAGVEPRGITAADYDGDGKMDLVVLDAAQDIINLVLYFAGLGGGQFDSPREISGSPFPYAITTLDVDGNGKPDFVSTSVSDESEPASLACQPSIKCNVIGTGDLEAGLFRPTIGGTIPMFRFPQVAVASADINADRLPDLFFLSQDGTEVSVVLNISLDGATLPTRTPTIVRTPTISRTPTPTSSPTVTPLSHTSLSIGSAQGRPGDTVDIVVSLFSMDVPVYAVRSSIAFDYEGSSSELYFDPGYSCAVNPSIGKEIAGSMYQRYIVDVDDENYTSRMRWVGVISVTTGSNADPIPNGPLYTCHVRISGGALPRTIPLFDDGQASVVVSADSTLVPVPATGGSLRISLVGTPSPGATSTPTPTATPTPTLATSSSKGGCSLVVNETNSIPGMGAYVLFAMVLGIRRRRAK